MDRLRQSPFFAGALVIAALYLGQAFFVPVALALLLAFMLAPLTSRLEHLGLRRTPAVIAVCLAIGLLASGISGIAARELASLVEQAPSYRANLVAKIAALRGPLGSMERAADAVSDLEDEFSKPAPGEAPRDRPAPKVEVVESSDLWVKVGGIVSPLAYILGVAGIVTLLAIFMLLEREELRDRAIRLIGGRDLTLTTSALDDAASRLSRFLGMQALLSGTHGILAGVGLALLGIPGALLWGALSALLRFVPYVGPWLATILPIATAAGAFDSWTPALACVGFFIALELLSNGVLEPWLLGASVGLSPFAVVFSAVFWSWLWGIPGLLLATPISACLVVVGRHVRGLEFFAILLSDEPALEPGMRLYQRLLAGDLDEAEAILEAAAAEPAPQHLTDRVVLPALARLAEDIDRGTLEAAQGAATRTMIAELLASVRKPSADTGEVAGARVVCIPATDESDDLASRWVAQDLVASGLAAVSLPAGLLVSEQVARAAAAGCDAICVSALTPRGWQRARHLTKRLIAEGTVAEIFVGAWASAQRGTGTRARWITTTRELFAELEPGPQRPALR